MRPAQGKEPLCVSSRGWAAGPSRSPSQAVPCTDCRFCVWGKNCNSNLFVLTRSNCQAKQDNLPCRCGHAPLLRLIHRIFFECQIHYTCIRFSTVSPSLICFDISNLSISCHVITPSRSSSYGSTASLNLRCR